MAVSPSKFRVFAGVSLIDSSVVNATLEYGRTHYDTMSFHHAYRSWIFGSLFASKLPAFAEVDREVHAVAALLHDLAWDHTSDFSTPDLRFEVDGANAARSFLEHAAPDWDHCRVQLVWDAIALHTTGSIARHKEPEVALCNLGIVADFAGPRVPGDILTAAEFEAVVKELPYLDLKEGVKRLICGLCIHKPDTTYDNAARDFGVLFEPGYDPTPANAALRLLQPLYG